MDAVGNFSVAWKDFRNDNFDIFCRRFYSDGSPMESSFQVNSDTGTAHQSRPWISTQDDGRFIVTWTDTRNGNSDIFAQRYLGDGFPYNDNFQITNTALMEQSFSSVLLENNRIYTTWQDNRGGQTGYDIWANVLDWDVGVGIEEKLLPGMFSISCLHQNYPNPFNSSTTISYSLNASGFVNLSIYDLQGRKVKSMVHKYQKADIYSIVVDGSELTGGIYFYKLEVGGRYNEVRKMVVVK